MAPVPKMHFGVGKVFLNYLISTWLKDETSCPLAFLWSFLSRTEPKTPVWAWEVEAAPQEAMALPWAPPLVVGWVPCLLPWPRLPAPAASSQKKKKKSLLQFEGIFERYFFLCFVFVWQPWQPLLIIMENIGLVVITIWVWMGAEVGIACSGLSLTRYNFLLNFCVN